MTPERIEELHGKAEKCPHGLYGVCYFCGWGALAWIIASLLALCAFAVLSCQGAQDFPSRGIGQSAVGAGRFSSSIITDGLSPSLVRAELIHGSATRLSDRFYDALAQVESGNRNVPGDHGRSAGPYQFTAKAWEQANRLRTKALMPIGSVKPLPYKLAHDLRTATLMVEYYCPWLEAGLTRTLRRKPTVGEIYCAYNLGPLGFRQFGNKIKLCPATTRNAAAKMERLMK